MLQELTFFLALFTSLQLVRSHNDDGKYHCIGFLHVCSIPSHIHAVVSATLQSMNTLLGTLVTKSNTQLREIYQLKAQMEEDLRSLRENLNSLNDSVNNISDSLQEYKQQTAANCKSAELQAFLTSGISKLDIVNATSFQLSSDHQEIQASIFDAQHVASEGSTNLSQQLQTIQQHLGGLSAHTCGGIGGWRRVVYLDMTDPSTNCPSGWQETGFLKRSCGSPYCGSATFPVSGGQYSQVCGRIKAYQHGPTTAFLKSQHHSIDSSYVNGVSVTHGSPRKHIWTFAAGNSESRPTASYSCPCDANITINTPPYVGDHYFCESGVNEQFPGHNILYSNDTLWDGENCLTSSRCCIFQNPPYFYRQLPNSTSDDIEARVCKSFRRLGSVAIELLELYVQ